MMYVLSATFQFVKKGYLLTVVLLLICACKTSTAFEEEVLLPKLYIANFTSQAPKIDGVIEPGIWDKASWSDPFIDIEGKKIPKYQTRIKLVWDQEHCYILAQLKEPHLWGNLKQRDTVVFYNNDFEVFIDPDGDTHDYMELEVNLLNTVWDLFLEKPYRNKTKADSGWDIEGLQTAVGLSGTLNDPSDIDNLWYLEMALPWKSLERGNPSGQIPENNFWRMNFSRVNWDHELKKGRYYRKKDSLGNYLPEYNWVWSPQGVINMHEPERWGYVYFAKSENTDTITLPKDAALLQWMYQQYRSQLKKIKTNQTTDSLITSTLNGNTIQFKRMTQNDTDYWETQSPQTKIIYKILHNGKLLVFKSP